MALAHVPRDMGKTYQEKTVPDMLGACIGNAPPPLVAELVDAPDLGSGAERRAGSSPAEGTKITDSNHLPQSGYVGESPAVDVCRRHLI